ncbi:MAG: hypothetical protein ACRD3C_23015 [Vicinamibacterales bacterium]
MTSSLSSRLILAGVNIALLLVFAEILGLAAYYADTGALFYVHRKSYPALLETAQQALTADALHPYFGPTHRRGHPFHIPDDLREPEAGGAATTTAPLATNNFGFVSRHDYPFRKTRDDQFLVGIFGGSVGLWFCHVGATRMIADLKQSNPFRNRDVIPLCFSHEGYKQPQQLLVLSYFLSLGQQFDLVVNIDGFNEVALSAMNSAKGVDISMPSPMHLDPLVNLIDQATLTPEKLYLLADINRDKETLNGLVATIGRNRFASANFVLERLYERTSRRYVSELGRFASLRSNPASASLVEVTPPVVPRDAAATYEDAATNWATSSIMMSELLSSRGVPYFHVLQPNQYFTQRRFSDDEARVAINGESPFKESVEQGYPALVRAAKMLKPPLHYLSAVELFDDAPEPVYMDDCCHYTLAGNRRLGSFIAESILKALR